MLIYKGTCDMVSDSYFILTTSLLVDFTLQIQCQHTKIKNSSKRSMETKGPARGTDPHAPTQPPCSWGSTPLADGSCSMSLALKRLNKFINPWWMQSPMPFTPVTARTRGSRRVKVYKFTHKVLYMSIDLISKDSFELTRNIAYTAEKEDKYTNIWCWY